MNKVTEKMAIKKIAIRHECIGCLNAGMNHGGTELVTLKDVANETGLAVTTVSRILNNRGYISVEAKERVHAAVAKLNYQPNEIARSLSKQTSNTIGVIVPHIHHPYFSELISDLENQANLNGRKILLFNSKEKDEKEKEYLNMCSGNRVSGVVLCSGNVALKDFELFDVPVITIERYTENRSMAIECDNFLGGKLAAEHLIECGCKKMIYFSGIDETAMPADLRAAGFQEICHKRNVMCKEVKTSALQYDHLDYHEEIERALKENPDTDGIFASSDVIAAQILQVCRSLGIDVPSRMKIVGFDDVNISTLTTPQITTIHQPVEEMARIAVEYLLKVNEGNVVPSRTVLPVFLVRRETT